MLYNTFSRLKVVVVLIFYTFLFFHTGYDSFLIFFLFSSVIVD